MADLVMLVVLVFVDSTRAGRASQCWLACVLATREREHELK